MKHIGPYCRNMAFKGCWLKEKVTIDLNFPNVPYYMDGSIKLTQSIAIMRYLARKHGLVATDEIEIIRQDLLEQQLTDIRLEFFGLLRSEDYNTERVEYIAKTLPQRLDSLSRFLGTRQWFTGNHINYVDFMAYEFIDWFRVFSPETVDKYQNLIQMLTRFESLPTIKTYMELPEFITWPLLPPQFQWGFKK
ncbi:unnamed protein product [Medioppia subpectinata]|uniref:glutathione transferase n=1 Tax=Medioppia subpectinata TaxID=1979941 RepID=A0A7R9KEY0_9ACAR|nr:unnamed protein product [Medioppia subpectinata]CAG2102095.1 unnamed protein product [Medioppia subpectinata]